MRSIGASLGWRVFFSACFVAASASASAPVAQSEDEPTSSAPTAALRTTEQAVRIPLADAHGRTIQLHARVCYREGAAPATLVLINHGSPPNASDRPKMLLGRCDGEAAQWFLSRGYVVGFVLRRGYGETGGAWAEDQGGCLTPNFVRAGLETAIDMDATVRGLTTLPFVKPTGVVIVGQSAGGWGAIAYDSGPHPQVAAFVVMAGGRGGHRDNQPNNNCRPDLLAEAAGQFGKTATTPMLWIYTANDSYFAPAIARAMWHAFSTAGGQGDFEQPGPYGKDGHRLFFGDGGSAVWGPLVERYLATMIAAPGQ
jgi:dienelactone hydrolase